MADKQIKNLTHGALDIADYLVKQGISDIEALNFTTGDLKNLLLSYLADINHTHSFSSITGRPTTISGYGITDAFLKSLADTLYSAIGHTHTFSSLTGKPTTVAGYGITDILPYKVYTANISQADTSDPVATVLQNTFPGTVSISRYGVGSYSISCTSGLLSDATKVFIIGDAVKSGVNISMYVSDSSTIDLITRTDDMTTLLDNVLLNYPIEIRLYP